VKRLSGKADGRWIDHFDLDAAICIVQNLGIVLAFGGAVHDRDLSVAELAEANDAGFQTVNSGKDGFVNALNEILCAVSALISAFLPFGALRSVGIVDMIGLSMR